MGGVGEPVGGGGGGKHRNYIRKKHCYINGHIQKH